MMTVHYGLQNDPALPPLLALTIGNDAYPVRLYGFLSARAPQIGNLA